MNNGFYKDLDTNFEIAYELSEKDFSHSELIVMLKNGYIPQRQIAALKLDTLLNLEDAKILFSNLTGCDGKIREAVALKINQLLKNKICAFDFFNFPEIFADATIDINGNICRLCIESATYLKDFKNFSNLYTEKIIKFSLEALQELDNFIFKDKKYVINKQLFKLYWCLEAIKYFYSYIEDKTLNEILTKASLQNEYTIREKVAEILNISKKFPDLYNNLQKDENYYVKFALLNH